MKSLEQVRVNLDNEDRPREVVHEAVVKVGTGETHVYRAVLHSIEIRNGVPYAKVVFRAYCRKVVEKNSTETSWFGLSKKNKIEVIENDTSIWAYNSDDENLVVIDTAGEYWRVVELRLQASGVAILRDVVKDSFIPIHSVLFRALSTKK